MSLSGRSLLLAGIATTEGGARGLGWCWWEESDDLGPSVIPQQLGADSPQHAIGAVPETAGEGGEDRSAEFIGESRTVNSNKYQELAARTLIDGPEQPLNGSEISMLATILAMHDRLGKLTEKLKKNILHRHQSYDASNFLVDGEKLLDDLTEIFERGTAHPSRLAGQDTMVLWNVIGLLGESSEVAQLLLAWQLEPTFSKDASETTIAIEAMRKWTKELGDVAWYQAAISTKLGLSLEGIQQANIDKLRQRFPDGFTTADSVG